MHLYVKDAYQTEISFLKFPLGVCWGHVPKLLRSSPAVMAALSVGALKNRNLISLQKKKCYAISKSLYSIFSFSVYLT